MDVSPRALRAVTFREKLRGYHPEDVDKFLERVAEGVAALQEKLEEALTRASTAEQARAEASVSEEAVQRTLTLAQRTADMALKEAKEEAARIVAEARDEADRIADEAQRQLREDLEKLETARKQLADDVRAMHQYVDQERTRVRTALSEILRKVDSTARKAPPPPAPSKLDVPPGVARPERTLRSVESPAPEPVEDAELAPPVTEPALPRREPQPPPVAGRPFGAARPAAGKPAGPPPGPRRMPDPQDPPDPSPEPTFEDGDQSRLRSIFGG